MTEEAKKAQAAYKRAWAAKNPDKVKKNQEAYWERKAIDSAFKKLFEQRRGTIETFDHSPEARNKIAQEVARLIQEEKTELRLGKIEREMLIQKIEKELEKQKEN